MQESLFEEPIAKPVQEFITLFNQELKEVSFPDINAAVLESLASKVNDSAKALQEALSKADEARKTLEASQQDLLLKAARGLAYAKVYAEDNPALTENLFKINLGKAARSPKKIQDDSQKAEKSAVLDAKPEEKKQRQPKKAPEHKSDEPALL